MSFVHLHTHSEYSLLDGANRIGDLLRRAAEYEMPGLALTDHGCMFGTWEFLQQAKKTGVKPIAGMEAYVAPGDRRDRSGGRDERAYYHLVLLARDAVGYRNLVKLTSIGYREGFYHRPRIDHEVLAAHSEGLIVSSACMAGEVARYLADGDRQRAKETAAWYAGLFRDRYYLEVQAHASPGQDALNAQIFELAGELGLPVVATNDAHFLRPEDHDAHDVLLCIGLGKDRSDANRMRYDDGLYFKAADEIRAHFPDHPEVLENTLKIADEVDLSFEKQYHVPRFPLPADVETEPELLRRLTFEGAHERFGPELRPDLVERLEYELGVISNDKADYAGYFLITQDFIRWAKDHGIPVGPGRGSAAGSLVAYCLDITDLDPIEFDLLFERFLNPDRVSMPDIDIDFCYERRGEVIEYVREKYGRDSVGQIITFGTMKSRAVVRDVGRVLGFEPSETDRLAKLIPNSPNMSLTVGEAVEQVGELRELYNADQRVRQLVEYAKTLEGLSRHSSVHAAGVVIAPGPLDDYVPVCTQPGKGGHDDVLVTQWDMNALEQAGMLKMDFLGLKTLTVIHDAVQWIVRRHGALKHPGTGKVYADIRHLELDDDGVYQMLARGGTIGVFQFESSLATDKLRSMKCDRFEDLVATNALIRPGPLDSGMTDVFVRRKLGREKVSYPHPDLVEVLEPTYGVITYQEQVMRIAQVLAGFTLAEADVLRKAVGKKDAELIQKELAKFTTRAVERGVEPGLAKELADQIETFGRYGFNRSHSAAYALLSYQTAWLKRYYPSEFMAAMLSSVVDRTEDVVKYIGECRELGRYVDDFEDGVSVLAPSVNESDWKFTPVSDTQVRFGLGAVRGLGESAVNSILSARAEKPFESLFDLAERVDLRATGRRAMEALICAGALDAFGDRARLMAALDNALGEAQVRQREREAGQSSLFDMMGGADDAPAAAPEQKLPEVAPWPEAERLKREKEILGFFISGHPLDKYREELRVFESVNTSNLREHRDRKVELACVVTTVSRQISKRNGAEWARLTVEDFYGTATVLAFGEQWEKHKPELVQDAVVLLRGTVSGRDRDEEDPPLFLDDAIPLARLAEDGSLAIELRLAPAAVGDPDAVGRATEALKSHRGGAPVFVVWPEATPDAERREHRLRSRSLGVRPSPDLLEELRGVFGRERVRLVRGPNGGGNGSGGNGGGNGGNGYVEGRGAGRVMTGGD